MALKKSLKDRLNNIKQKLDDEVSVPREMEPEISKEEQLRSIFRTKFKKHVLTYMDEVIPGINDEMQGTYTLKLEHNEQEEFIKKERTDFFCLVTRYEGTKPEEEQNQAPFLIFQGYPMEDKVRVYTNQSHEDPEHMEGHFLSLEEIDNEFIENHLVALLDQATS